MTDLIARLRAAEKDERLSTGALYQEAADALEQLARENERLRAGGCARDQRTTQYCAEAQAAQAELARVKKDAERYRFLRNACGRTQPSVA